MMVLANPSGSDSPHIAQAIATIQPMMVQLLEYAEHSIFRALGRNSQVSAVAWTPELEAACLYKL
jgi:hypothetical protein